MKNGFFQRKATPIPMFIEIRKDWPENGEVTCCWFQDDGASGLIHILQNEQEAERFRSIVVFKAPCCKFVTEAWSPGILCDLVDLAFHTVESVLNRRGVRKLRAADAEYYTVLALRNFTRGPPLLPNSEAKGSCVTVSTEKPRLRHWSRFPVDKVRLSDYLAALLERLGYELKTNTILDGNQLVPYQCVVEVEAFQKIHGPLFEALRVQKAAYRRANGGTVAPSLMEAWIDHQAVTFSFLPH